MTTSNNNEFSISIMLVVGWLVAVGLIYLIVIPTAEVSDGKKMQPVDERNDAAIVARIKPVITLADIMDGSPKAQAMPVVAAKSAKALYDGACLACHATGVAGAPKLGDATAWELRYANGLEPMLSSAKSGKGAMPPNGGSSYSEQEMRNVIEFMLAEAGLLESTSTLVPSTQTPLIEESVKPIGTFKNEQPSVDLAAGSKAYRGACFVCHDAGVAGAPRLGDKIAWAVRIANGFDAMLQTALSGKGAMPPKGGANYLSDIEIANIVAFMVDKAK